MSESRLVRSSIVWIVAVPVAARVVGALRRNVTEPEWARSAVESLHLPFSWQVLFFGSLALAASVKVFDLLCPAVIRENGSYGDFMAAGRGVNHLSNYLKALCAGPIDALKTPVEKEPAWKAGSVLLLEHRDREVLFCQDKGPMQPMYPTMEKATTFPGIGDPLSEKAAFWGIWDHANHHRPGWIQVASVSYFVGLLCFGFVFLQNLWWVASVVFS